MLALTPELANFFLSFDPGPGPLVLDPSTQVQGPGSGPKGRRGSLLIFIILSFNAALALIIIKKKNNPSTKKIRKVKKKSTVSLKADLDLMAIVNA